MRTSVAKNVVHTGRQVHWRRNPADIYTVEGARDASLFRDGKQRLRITNVHGHDLWVPADEVYDYRPRQ